MNNVKVLRTLFFLIFFFQLISCSQNFTNTHKMYAGKPAKNETISYVQLGESFMLTRADWFADYDSLRILTDSIIANELKKIGNISTISDKNFSKETLKMDNKVFIKTKFPQQGVKIGDANYLFIINEYTIGADLNSQDFYDYTKANAELKQKKKFKNISIIATFTLWDNNKQIPLKSSIVEVQTPSNTFALNLYEEAVKKMVAQCIDIL